MGAAPIQADRQEDMTNLVGAFRDYAKAPKKTVEPTAIQRTRLKACSLVCNLFPLFLRNEARLHSRSPTLKHHYSGPNIYLLLSHHPRHIASSCIFPVAYVSIYRPYASYQTVH
jgi:hypothetical protein